METELISKGGKIPAPTGWIELSAARMGMTERGMGAAVGQDPEIARDGGGGA